MNNDLTLVIKAINQAQSQLKQVQNDLNQFGKSTDATKAKVEGLNKTQADAQATMERYAGTLRNLLAGGVLYKFGQQILQTAGALEQQEVAFRVLLGSEEEAMLMLQELTEFAKKTPFNIPGVRENAKQMMAYGIEVEKVIPTMTVLGNLSLGNAEKFNRLTYAYGQVRSANKLYGTELRQFTETGIPIIAALAEQFNITKSEVRDFVEDGKVGFKDVEAALNSLSGEGGQFFGLMDETSQTLLGRFSNLQDSLIQFIEISRTTEGFDVIKEGIADVTEFIETSEDAKEAFADFSNGVVIGIVAIQKQLEIATAGFRGFANLVEAGFSTLDNIGQTAGSTIFDVKQVLTGKAGIGSIGSSYEATFARAEATSAKFVANATKDYKSMQDTIISGGVTIDRLVNDIKKPLEQVEKLTRATSSVGGGAAGGETPLEKMAAKEAKAAEKIQSDLERLDEQYEDFKFKASLAVLKLSDTHDKEVAKIVGRFQDLRESLSELKGAYEDDLDDMNNTVAAKYVEQEKIIKDLQADILEARTNRESTTELEKELDRQMDAVKDFKKEFVDESQAVKDAKSELADLQWQLRGFSRFDENAGAKSDLESQVMAKKKEIDSLQKSSGSLGAQIDEERRKAALTEFERFLEENELRVSETKERYEAEREEIKTKLLAEQDALKEETELYKSKIENYHDAFDAFEAMRDGIEKGNLTMVQNTEQTVEDLQVAYSKLKQQIDLVRAATAPKSGADLRTDAQVFGQTGVNQPFPVDGFTPRTPQSADPQVNAGGTTVVNMTIGSIDSRNRAAQAGTLTARALQTSRNNSS